MAEAITHRRILAMALPVVLSNATVPILGLVDTGVVGQLGRAAPIGAVGLGAMILTALYWIFGFLRMGITGLAAQAIGQKDDAECTALLVRGLLIGALAGLVLIVAQIPLIGLGLRLSPAGAEVEALARDYMTIRIWSAPAAIAIYALTGWLIADGRTGAVLLLQLWLNGSNIALDLAFVPGFGWGVSGVAWATFIAEWSTAALGLWLCRHAFAGTAWRDRSRILDRARLRRMAVVNTDILIRSLLLQAIFLSFVMLGARFSDVQLAANQVLLQFLYVTAYALDGFAFTAEALVGQAVGAGDRARLTRAVRLTGIWTLGTCVVLSLAFAGAGGWGIDLLTTATDVRSSARSYLPYMVAAPLAGAAAWLLDGVFIGATRGRDMRNMMGLSAAIYAVAVIPLVAVFDNHGLWLALLVSFVARGASLGSRYADLVRSTGAPAVSD